MYRQDDSFLSEEARERVRDSTLLADCLLSSKFFIISQRDSRQSISAWGKEESGGGGNGNDSIEQRNEILAVFPSIY